MTRAVSAKMDILHLVEVVSNVIKIVRLALIRALFVQLAMMGIGWLVLVVNKNVLITVKVVNILVKSVRLGTSLNLKNALNVMLIVKPAQWSPLFVIAAIKVMD